jgi:CRP/FNR family transcriptional regulator, cyclic AMP receptor protein
MLHPHDKGLYPYLQAKYDNRITENIIVRRYRKGEYIYAPPTRLNYICELISGSVKLGCFSDKEDVVHEILEPGEFFGNFRYLKGQLFAEHSRAVVTSEIRLYEIDFFKDVINRDPVTSDWFMAQITSRWRKTECRLLEITSYEPRQRIRRLYQQLTRSVLDAHQQVYRLNELITFKEMADLTGTTRQLVAQEIKSYTSGINVNVNQTMSLILSGSFLFY